MMTADRHRRRERLRRRMVVYTRRMIAAMLCWTALQAAAAHVVEPAKPGIVLR